MHPEHVISMAYAPLLQLGVRYYDGEMGRFTQLDPIKDGLNWYIYVDGNPVVGVDPWGRKALNEQQWKKVNCHLRALCACMKPSRGHWGYGQLLRDICKYQDKDNYFDNRYNANDQTEAWTKPIYFWGGWTGIHFVQAMKWVNGKCEYSEELAATIIHEMMHRHNKYWYDYIESGLANSSLKHKIGRYFPGDDPDNDGYFQALAEFFRDSSSAYCYKSVITRCCRCK